MIRIGQGFDVHAFGPGDHVIMGGVRIPHTQGLVAHSDGDVAVHALCDALLGALALGDIGRHFPDTDPRWKGADSLRLLAHCMALVRERGYTLGNADITVICQEPKLGPHVESMRARIASTLECDVAAIGIKATTSEKLGFIGRGEGAAAHAVATIRLPFAPGTP